MQMLYTKSFKTLQEEIRENLNKWRGKIMDCKTQFEMSFVPKLMYNFNAILFKFPTGLGVGQIEKLLLNMYGNAKDLG